MKEEVKSEFDFSLLQDFIKSIHRFKWEIKRSFKMTARTKTKHGQRERLRITSSLNESIFTMWFIVSLERIRIS